MLAVGRRSGVPTKGHGRKGHRSACREAVLERLANVLLGLDPSHPTRIGIDGVDAAGKTTLADELSEIVVSADRQAIRASIDGFHRPRAERYLRGPYSPEGYYRDSFDRGALRESLLDPLGPRGNRRYRTAVFDFRADAPVATPLRRASENAVLLFDGVFLLRPELARLWDLVIYVDVDHKVAVERAVTRDAPSPGSTDAVRNRYRRRYVPGQAVYHREVRPRQRADVVLENTDPALPRLVFRADTSEGEDG
jgi:uridine kinase